MVREGGSMKRWTESEANWLREHYQTLGAAECARRIGCDVERVHWKASALGVSHRAYRHWRTDEVRLVTENYTHRGAAWCADVLRRSVNSVRGYARAHGLQMAKRPWTDAELDGLRAVYASGGSVREFAERIGRAKTACTEKARVMGLRHRRYKRVDNPR